jgi:hypothetical protein
MQMYSRPLGGGIDVGQGLRAHRLDLHEPAPGHVMRGTGAQDSFSKRLHYRPGEFGAIIPDHPHCARDAAK